MRTSKFFLFLALAALAGGRGARAQEQPSAECLNCQPGDAAQTAGGAGAADAADPGAVTVEYFHDDLASYGQWTKSEQYGDVWVPHVASGWRPYTDGQWANTDQGWAWVGNEPWAWAAFHYGRWYEDPEAGWAWVPGNVWAPSWVSWRQGGEYVGWAPLPPSAGFSAERGLEIREGEIPARSYAFVPARSLLAPRLSAVVMARERNGLVLGRTAEVTHFSSVGGHVVAGGVSVASIERATGRTVRSFQIAARQTGRDGGRPAGGQLAFAQPATLVRAARASHGEFGPAFHGRVDARQAKESTSPRAAGERSAHSAPGARPGGSYAAHPAGVGGAGQPAQGEHGQVRGDGQPAGTTRTGSAGSGVARAGIAAPTAARTAGSTAPAAGGQAAQQPKKAQPRADKDRKPPA